MFSLRRFIHQFMCFMYKQFIHRNSFSGRGRGAMTAGRGRGRAKPKVEEPVILTLISDDEDDEQKV